MHLRLQLSAEQHFQQDTARAKQVEGLGTVYNFPKSFGLKSRDWKSFDQILKTKNAENPDGVRHVLFLLARHGQGYHNIGEEYVGSKRWKRPSKISPDKPIHTFFPDARLTPVGQHQADTLAQTFSNLLYDRDSPMPWPQAFYTSPLHRALETGYRTWSPNADEQQNKPYHPIVLESLREQMYIQHCNKRGTLSELQSLTFPPSRDQQCKEGAAGLKSFGEVFRFSASPWQKQMSEHDEMFAAQEACHCKESQSSAKARAYDALCEMFAQTWADRVQYISVTTHAGLMSAIYQAFDIHHDEVPRFPTGIVVPILIRAEKIEVVDGVDESKALRVEQGDQSEDQDQDYWDVSGNLDGDVLCAEEEATESLEDVLATIRDESVYEKLIDRVEMFQSTNASEHEGKEEIADAQLNALERLIIRALV